MTSRLLLHFDIDQRQPELRHGAAPDDMVLRRRDTPLPFPAGTLAYCVDMQAERMLYSVHGKNLPRLLTEPFLYAAQLRDASGMVSVPFERLAEFEMGIDPPCPTLIFSPGRAGSTLLARLLAACGAASASEPDVLPQVCRFQREDRMRIGPDMERNLLRACLIALGRALVPAVGTALFVKLHSHCNARPLPIVESIPGSRAIFLLRRQCDWARSRHQAFGEPPESVAFALRQAADAMDKLLGTGIPMQIIWFEDLARDPAGTLGTCLPSEAIDSGTLLRVMAEDAQAGTPLARAELRDVPVAHGFDDAFVAAWHRARAGAEWSAETQTLLAAMEMHA